MRKLELRPLETNQPGHGQLVIIGWKGESEGLSLDIQRNQDECFLQKDGQWLSSAFKFHLPPLQQEADGSLTTLVDKELVDPLLANSHATHMARLYGADGAEAGKARLRLAHGLMPSRAGGSSPALDAGSVLNTPPPTPTPATVAEPADEPVREAEPPAEPAPAAAPAEPPQQPVAEKRKGKRWLWILLAVLILGAILAASAWFGMSMRDQQEPPAADEPAVEESLDDQAQQELLSEESIPDEASEESVPEAAQTDEPAPAETAAAGPCSLQRMGEVGELDFIQACTAAGSDSGTMLDVIAEARNNNHCGIARRLYAHQALNGDTAAALAYAQEFDPARHSASACFPEPDAETAIFWYETALGLDADNAEASRRLEELQG